MILVHVLLICEELHRTPMHSQITQEVVEPGGCCNDEGIPLWQMKTIPWALNRCVWSACTEMANFLTILPHVIEFAGTSKWTCEIITLFSIVGNTSNQNVSFTLSQWRPDNLQSLAGGMEMGNALKKWETFQHASTTTKLDPSNVEKLHTWSYCVFYLLPHCWGWISGRSIDP